MGFFRNVRLITTAYITLSHAEENLGDAGLDERELAGELT